MKRFFVLLATMLCVGINLYADDTCKVLDVDGKETRGTIDVRVLGADNEKGEVYVTAYNDYKALVNASVTVTISKNVTTDKEQRKKQERISVNGENTGTFTIKVKPWKYASKKEYSDIKVDISGARCQ
jgi:hypothetical protein